MELKKLPEEWKKELKRLPWLLLIPVGLALPSLCGSAPASVENIYSKGIYPLISGTLGAITGLLPFSFAELLLYAIVFGLPVLIAATVIRAILRRIRWIALFRLLLTLFILSGLALNAFYVLWGFNYSRNTLAEQLSLDVRERSVDELEELCFSLADQAIVLRRQVQEDKRGVFALPGGISDSLRSVPEAYKKLSTLVPQFLGPVSRPKRVLASEGLSWAGISGIYIPFTAEPNVNTHQPALLIPSSAAHESAHSLGIAREDEANFAAYLACMASNDPAMQYSGVMLALIHAGNELNRERPLSYSKLFNTYSQGMLRDILDYDAYWDKYEGPVEQTVNEVNDNYLKHNRQEDGVKSYGEMIDLLLALREKQTKTDNP